MKALDGCCKLKETKSINQTPGRSRIDTGKGGTIYDRIAEAREKRGRVLSDRQSTIPPADDEHVGVTGLLKEKAPDTNTPRPATNATPARKPRGSSGIWALSAMIAAVAIGAVFWGSRPASMTLADIVPTVGFRPPAPEVIVLLERPADIPADPLSFEAIMPNRQWSPPSRVQFEDMPRAAGPPEIGFSPDPVTKNFANLRVLLNAPRTVSDASLAAVIDALAQSGAQPSPQRVNLTISASNVRFYHPDDAEAAAAIADGIGASLRDFTDFDPRPPAGLVEIWLAGKEIDQGQAGNTTRSAGGPLDQFARDLRRLERSLRQALRRGN